MTLTVGEIIRAYREHNDLSLEDFARMSGLTKAYISKLEHEVDPRNGKPINPTIDAVGGYVLPHLFVDEVHTILHLIPNLLREARYSQLQHYSPESNSLPSEVAMHVKDYHILQSPVWMTS